MALQPCAMPAQAVYSTEHLPLKEGLSHRWAYDVTQDSLGYIWIWTRDKATYRYRPAEDAVEFFGVSLPVPRNAPVEDEGEAMALRIGSSPTCKAHKS